jgi:hypothetical protein
MRSLRALFLFQKHVESLLWEKLGSLGIELGGIWEANH